MTIRALQSSKFGIFAAILLVNLATICTAQITTAQVDNARGLALRFNVPTIVNGHVYIGAKREVDVYGLLPAKQ